MHPKRLQKLKGPEKKNPSEIWQLILGLHCRENPSEIWKLVLVLDCRLYTLQPTGKKCKIALTRVSRRAERIFHCLVRGVHVESQEGKILSKHCILGFVFTSDDLNLLFPSAINKNKITDMPNFCSGDFPQFANLIQIIWQLTPLMSDSD